MWHYVVNTWHWVWNGSQWVWAYCPWWIKMFIPHW
jgi:hypothetical protein